MNKYLIAPPIFEGRPEEIVFNKLKLAMPNIKVIEDLQTNFKIEPGDIIYNEDVLAKEYYPNLLKMVINLPLDDRSILFFVEGWNPFIPYIYFYFNYHKKINPKIITMFHAGCHVPGDPYGEDINENIYKTYSKNIEKSIIDLSYLTIIATKYLYNFLPDLDINKTFISNGLPLENINNLVVLDWKNKENKIVFNHRVCEDKRARLFNELSKDEKLKNYKFVVSSPFKLNKKQLSMIDNCEIYYPNNKHEYYEFLNTSKFVFSSAKLETFGYSVVDGVRCGCIPILNKDNKCYIELYSNDEVIFYDTLKEIPWLLQNINVNLKQNNLIKKINYFNDSVNRISEKIINL